jgi:dolichol-phosphate mannosyltransferase
MKLTVVIPTYNEIENLPKMAAALFDLPLPDLNLLIVDDNSPDGTGELAEDLAKQYAGRISVMHRPGKQGLGTAYLQGFTQALVEGADFICQMDADFSHSPQKIVEMYAEIENYDLVIGSRYVEGGELDRDWPIWRKWLSSFGNIYARIILWLPVRDVTAGFRMWRKHVLESMPLHRVRSNGYAFQIEMANMAYRLGFRIKEIPIYFAERNRGTSKMSLQIQLEAALRVFQILLAYRDLKSIKQ